MASAFLKRQKQQRVPACEFFQQSGTFQKAFLIASHLAVEIIRTPLNYLAISDRL
jgi:hypothetical protein